MSSDPLLLENDAVADYADLFQLSGASSSLINRNSPSDAVKFKGQKRTLY